MEKKLVRLVNDKKLAGVCAGLARYFGMDVTIMRVAYLILHKRNSIIDILL